jgi:hypothetical protein
MLADRRAREFLEGLDRSEDAQAAALQRIVGANEGSAFGREHGFARVRSIADYRTAVPIRDYEGHRPYVDRIVAGESNVLTSEPVRRFFVTSGSLSKPKLVPVTSSFIKDKSRAFGVFWSLFFRDHPSVDAASLVTSFSDPGRVTTTKLGVPLSSETAFWAEATRATARSEPIIPRSVTAIHDSAERYRAIADALAGRDVRAMMALNPSTLLRLFDVVSGEADRLIAALGAAGRGDRAEELGRVLAERGRLVASDVWPRLEAVVSWRSPMLAPYLALLAPHLEGVRGRDYLMMASEGIMAIPLEDGASGGALAAGVHFYELIPIASYGTADPPAVLPHEVDVGSEYALVLTTSAGLYRYDIGDVVRVRGFRGTTPIIEFLHRAGRTSSFTGEKLTEAHVSSAALEAAERASVELSAFTLVPVTDGVPRYRLLAEARAPASREAWVSFLRAFEERLAAHNSEYREKRRSSRLGPVDLAVVRPGSFSGATHSDATEEQTKPVRLTRDPSFGSTFEVVELFR